MPSLVKICYRQFSGNVIGMNILLSRCIKFIQLNDYNIMSILG